MRTKVKLKDKIIQRSIGFKGKQIEFLNWCDEEGILKIGKLKISFKPDTFMRYALNEQIKQIVKYYPEVIKFLEI